MDHKLNIKFGEVNNLSDARYASGMGAAFMGFNLSSPNPRYVDPDSMKEISNWAPGPAIVTEWDNESAEVIASACNRLGIEYVQLNKFNPVVTSALKADFCVIQNIDIPAEEHSGNLIQQVSEVNGLAMYYMLSFNSIDDQEKFLSKPGNELLITELCRDQPVFLNFHFNAQNIVSLVEKYKPFGINFKGSAETKPGFQDYSVLNDLFDLVNKAVE
jgi:phosphoribosylanthranilate isomerase